jgi:hypothetical protein
MQAFRWIAIQPNLCFLVLAVATFRILNSLKAMREWYPRRVDGQGLVVCEEQTSRLIVLTRHDHCG